MTLAVVPGTDERSEAPAPGEPVELAQDGHFLALDELEKRFGERTAVAPLTLDIHLGEFVTLLGPSGCGKTTLLRMLAGLEVPTSGTIWFEGANLTRTPPERRPFNMVFQSYALFPHMNVYDNVAYGLRAAGRPEKAIHDQVFSLLELVGLESRAAQPVQQLSGGMSQRVALVRALANEPRVLLLDEPLGALDLQLRKRMQVELRSIQERLESTFVYVTHDQEEALVMSHRIVLMREGTVVQVGAPKDVYRRPRTRFSAEFIGAAGLVGARVVARRGTTVETLLPGGRRRAFEYYGDAAVAEGHEGLVVLRPEDMVLAANDEGDLSGILADATFAGPVTYQNVTLGDGSHVSVQRAADADQERGTTCGVTILPGRGVFVPAEESGIEPVA